MTHSDSDSYMSNKKRRPGWRGNFQSYFYWFRRYSKTKPLSPEEPRDVVQGRGVRALRRRGTLGIRETKGCPVLSRVCHQVSP